ncbi:hypothetical protein RJ641_028260, partial [Dillenia turbinata]
MICQDKQLAVFGKQLHKSHSRAVEAMQSISEATVNFSKNFSSHSSNCSQVVEDAGKTDENKLHEFEKKFEECAANEERIFLEKIAELLASSNARRKS